MKPIPPLSLVKTAAIVLAILFTACSSPEKTPFPKATDYNFFVISDCGKTGNLSPDVTAKEVNRLADILRPRFVINSGDNFHDVGVKDTLDPLWKIGFENLYTTPSLNIDFYGTIGNHEYMGNPQALVDYTHCSSRWKVPARYYTVSKTIDSTTTLRIIVLDTSPFLESYQKKDQYKEVRSQDTKKQVAWLDSVLKVSKEKWKIVIGHHPIYTSDLGHGNTNELIDQVDPLLRKYNVDFYFCGHVHSFQHLSRKGMDYIVTSSACKPRRSNPWFYTKFHARSLGFTLCSVSKEGFRVSFINEKGDELYDFRKNK